MPPLAITMGRAFMQPRLFPTSLQLIRCTEPPIMDMATADIIGAITIAADTTVVGDIIAGIAGKLKFTLSQGETPGRCVRVRRACEVKRTQPDASTAGARAMRHSDR